MLLKYLKNDNKYNNNINNNNNKWNYSYLN